MPQIPGELGLLDRGDIAEGLTQEGIGIEGVNHVLEGIGILYAHVHDRKDLGGGLVVFLVLIRVESGDGALEDSESKLAEDVNTGKHFKKEDFIPEETSS
ncbi:MAG: hypothetical protein ACE5R6_15435 [Candidatus Heimdallarchaeota archaeon]